MKTIREEHKVTEGAFTASCTVTDGNVGKFYLTGPSSVASELTLAFMMSGASNRAEAQATLVMEPIQLQTAIRVLNQLHQSVYGKAMEGPYR